MQEPEPLGHRLLDEKIDACHVAAGSREAADKAKPNRVLADGEHDRNPRCRRFGRLRGRGAGRVDHGDLSADQIGQQRRQAIILALKPVILHRHILALDVAGFVEAFTKRGCIARVGFGRPVSDKCDHRGYTPPAVGSGWKAVGRSVGRSLTGHALPPPFLFVGGTATLPSELGFSRRSAAAPWPRRNAYWSACRPWLRIVRQTWPGRRTAPCGPSRYGPAW